MDWASWTVHYKSQSSVSKEKNAFVQLPQLILFFWFSPWNVKHYPTSKAVIHICGLFHVKTLMTVYLMSVNVVKAISLWLWAFLNIKKWVKKCLPV